MDARLVRQQQADRHIENILKGMDYQIYNNTNKSSPLLLVFTLHCFFIVSGIILYDFVAKIVHEQVRFKLSTERKNKTIRALWVTRFKAMTSSHGVLFCDINRSSSVPIKLIIIALYISIHRACLGYLWIINLFFKSIAEQVQTI